MLVGVAAMTLWLIILSPFQRRRRLCGCGEVRERCVLWYAGVPGRRAASDERVVLD